MTVVEHKGTTDIEFVTRIVTQVFWHILYHENALAKANRDFAFIKALLARGEYHEIRLSEIERDESGESGADEEPPENALDYVRNIVADCIHSMQWHEAQLRDAHEEFAHVKALLIRGKYTEIDLEKIRAEQAEKLK
jgi:hypothetical protein